MNNELVLAVLADLIRPRLSSGNPIKHALYATVAEVKESQHTYAVLQTSQTQAKEIIPGNFTWRYPCRLYAMFYPPEDAAYTPEAITAFMEEAGLALVASCSALLESEYPNFVPLDATVTGPIRWSPDASGGYEGSIAFSLTVQF